MALPSSGAITLAMLQAEFGGSTPISLSSYYRGGALVPNSAVNAAIPTSGPISLSQFYGAARAVEVAFSITAGTNTFNTGYARSLYGSYSGPEPIITKGGNSRLMGYLYQTNSGGASTVLMLFGASGGNLGRDWISYLKINGLTVNAVNAIYSYDTAQGYSTWQWIGPTPSLVSGSTYPAVIGYPP